MKNIKTRCAWVNDDPLYIQYHDQEWGKPVFDDRLLFEFLILEGAQAGLSWITVLKKRDNYQKAFDNFVPEKIAKYDEAKIKELMQNSGIIRNRLKIAAAIQNAKSYLAIKQEFGSFAKFMWQFVNGSPIQNNLRRGQVPSTSLESETMSKVLKKHGFKYVGSTICYAFMQAVGMVNDHTIDCFCYSREKRKKIGA